MSKVENSDREKNKNRLKTLLSRCRIIYHPAIQFMLRVVVGFLLIYFSLDKFSDPAQWAEVIYQYRLVPFCLVNFVSVLLCSIELFAGIGILLGIYTRASALLGLGIVTTYLAAIQINIFREVFIYCGCFRKQTYMTDVTYSNRNITFWVLVLVLLILLNKRPRWTLDQFIKKLEQKK